MNNITTFTDPDCRGFGFDAYLDDAGVWRWVSNSHVPFDDMLIANNVPADVLARCRAARKADNDAFFAEYRKNQPATPSAEELYEMRAAFGPGKVIVDMISGRRVQL